MKIIFIWYPSEIRIGKTLRLRLRHFRTKFKQILSSNHSIPRIKWNKTEGKQMEDESFCVKLSADGGSNMVLFKGNGIRYLWSGWVQKRVLGGKCIKKIKMLCLNWAAVRKVWSLLESAAFRAAIKLVRRENFNLPQNWPFAKWNLVILNSF